MTDTLSPDRERDAELAELLGWRFQPLLGDIGGGYHCYGPVGEIIIVENQLLGTVEPWMVFGPCEHRSLGYFCNAHNAHLANVYNLTLHLEVDEEHAIVAWCGTCRLYRAVDSAQIRALDPHAERTLPLEVERGS